MQLATASAAGSRRDSFPNSWDSTCLHPRPRYERLPPDAVAGTSSARTMSATALRLQKHVARPLANAPGAVPLLNDHAVRRDVAVGPIDCVCNRALGQLRLFEWRANVFRDQTFETRVTLAH